MHNQPEAQNLLLTARRLLLDQLVPELEGSRKYEALMIANAMGIAARESVAGEENAGEDQRQCTDFLKRHGSVSTHLVDEGEVAARLRNRQISGSEDDLYPLLLGLTERKLTISNPKFLAQRQTEGAG